MTREFYRPWTRSWKVPQRSSSTLDKTQQSEDSELSSPASGRPSQALCHAAIAGAGPSDGPFSILVHSSTSLCSPSGAVSSVSEFRKVSWSWAHEKIILWFRWGQVQEGNLLPPGKYHIALVSSLTMTAAHSDLRNKWITPLKSQTARCGQATTIPCDTPAESVLATATANLFKWRENIR